MAHCTKCGAVVADNAAFCGSCGTPQTVVTSTGASVGGPWSLLLRRRKPR